MGLSLSRRNAGAVVVVVAALTCILTAGCGSHERVEMALAKASLVTTSRAMNVAPAWSQPSLPRVSVAPMTKTSTSVPQRAMTTLSPSEQVVTPKLSTDRATGSELRVMSFNLRVPFILDATNHWGFRKKNVIKTIKQYQPDVLGTQEVVAEQADYLREELPEYGFRGVGRGDGDRQGEFAAVLYRRDKFKEIDHGYFWLSETPHKPGSKSWGAWSTRMCTWIKLQPLDGGPAFAIFNAHLDNMSGRSREMSAKLMHERIRSLAGGMPVIVTGDFNTDAGSEPYRLLLTGAHLGVPQLLFDAFRLANPKMTNDEGTRHDFSGKRGGDRIDWILCSGGFTPVSSEINRTRGLLGYPSDHFPVQAILRPTAQQPNAPVRMAGIE